MIHISVIPDLEVKGFQETPYAVVEFKDELVIGGMANGTSQGNPVVMLGLKTGEDEFLVAQTTLSLFLTVADALKAVHGDPR